MFRILLTNDDGIHSDGLIKLEEALREVGDVYTVAPASEMSGASHSLTLSRPLRIRRIDGRHWTVDGTPTDCVTLALHRILGEEERPHLCVSGINHGGNLGDDVTYSGTVAGALEAALLGIPAIAVSLQGGPDFDFRPSAAIALSVAEAVSRHPLPGRSFLNVNVPRGTVRGLRVTVQARRNHITAVTARVDPRGREYYWIDEAQDDWEPHDRSDYQAVKDGYVSITPLHPDLTAHSVLDLVEALPIEHVPSLPD